MECLTETGVQSRELTEIVRLELESHGDRVYIQGPLVPLGARSTQNFALAVHDIATTAIKYGSLSVAGGHVAVTWEILRPSSGPAQRFSWRETGGPPSLPPTRAGFGTIAIKQNIASEFKTEVRLDYTEQGLIYEFEVDLEVIKPDNLSAGLMAEV